MKKLLTLFIVLPLFSFSAEVKYLNYAYTDSLDSKVYNFTCTDGHNGSVVVNGNSIRWSSTNDAQGNETTYNVSIDEAARRACSKSAKKSMSHKLISIKKEAVVFKRKDGDDSIFSALTSNLNYNAMKALAMMGNHSYFVVDRQTKVNLLKKYKAHTVLTDKYGNYPSGKKGNAKKTMLIDGYYKVSDSSGNIFYVRKSDTK